MGHVDKEDVKRVRGLVEKNKFLPDMDEEGKRRG